MSNYVPPYTISNKMLELVSNISEKIGKITSHKELESKPHLRKNYINPALELNLIAMTIPDKPKSKNQRYIKQ